MKQLNLRKACSFTKVPYALAIIFIVTIMLLPTGCSRVPSTDPYLAEDRDTGWVKDITYLEETLPKVHKNLYFNLSEQDFLQQLEELKNKVPVYSDEQMEIALNVILAGMGDTHTGSNISSEYRYPLELHWFAEGIYIMGTSKEYQELLNARIITLNGKKIEEAADMLRPLLAGANESWFKTQVIYYLPMPGVLKYFGLSKEDEIGLDVELENGKMQTVKLKPISHKDYVPTEGLTESVPLYKSRPDENYWYEYLEDEKIIYFNYSSCRQMRDKPFEIFRKEFWHFVKSHEVNKLVIDIRENRGGISTILDPFIKEVKNSDFNQQGKLYVITGKNTFSSAVLNAVSLKKKTKAYFVGEATGGEPNHYGEVKQFKLPNSEITIRYSTKYFHWLDQDVNTLEPDKVIEETFDDYRQGAVPVLEWIINRN
ncbi:peptidase family S41 [Oxobacter pfennigii]|uniref:Peptidase family S41 n=1 Tax=Oxobacter pfennigii TaxID=36849 RepID=A0A0P8YUY6_9CLOT|nr:S41 family peptidase [Oxobacter pfennigii]KPU43511.1 peptidase family S41 [Oxobacter pfennigii]